MNYDPEEVADLREAKSMSMIAGSKPSQPKFATYLDELHAIANVLENKLEEVMLPDYPEKEDSVDAPSLSPLEHKLRHLVARYARLIRRINL